MNARFVVAVVALVLACVWLALPRGPLRTDAERTLLVFVHHAPRGVDFECNAWRWHSGEPVAVTSASDRALVPSDERLLVRVRASDGLERVTIVEPRVGAARAVELRFDARAPLEIAMREGGLFLSRQRVFVVPSEITHDTQLDLAAWLERTAAAQSALAATFEGRGLTVDDAARRAIEELLAWSLDGYAHGHVHDLQRPWHAPTPFGSTVVLAALDAGRCVPLGHEPHLSFRPYSRIHVDASGATIARSFDLGPTIDGQPVRVGLDAPRSAKFGARSVFGRVPSEWSATSVKLERLDPEVATRWETEAIPTGAEFVLDLFEPGAHRLTFSSLDGEGRTFVHRESVDPAPAALHEFEFPEHLEPTFSIDLACSGVDLDVVDACFEDLGAPFIVQVLVRPPDAPSTSEFVRPRSRVLTFSGFQRGMTHVEVALSPSFVWDREPTQVARPITLRRNSRHTFDSSTESLITLPVALVTEEVARNFRLEVAAPRDFVAGPRDELCVYFESQNNGFTASLEWDAASNSFVTDLDPTRLLQSHYTIRTLATGSPNGWCVCGEYVVDGDRVVTGTRLRLERGVAGHIEFVHERAAEQMPTAFDFALPDGRSFKARWLPNLGDGPLELPTLPLGTRVRLTHHTSEPAEIVVTGTEPVRMEIVD